MSDEHGLQLKYFVLNPTKKDDCGWASRQALLAYAEEIRRVDPFLATDLERWVTREVQNDN